MRELAASSSSCVAFLQIRRLHPSIQRHTHVPLIGSCVCLQSTGGFSRRRRAFALGRWDGLRRQTEERGGKKKGKAACVVRGTGEEPAGFYFGSAISVEPLASKPRPPECSGKKKPSAGASPRTRHLRVHAQAVDVLPGCDARGANLGSAVSQ